MGNFITDKLKSLIDNPKAKKTRSKYNKKHIEEEDPYSKVVVDAIKAKLSMNDVAEHAKHRK